MAKITMADGMVFEGTMEEIEKMTQMFGAKAEVADVKIGDTVRIVTMGGDPTASAGGFHVGDIGVLSKGIGGANTFAITRINDITRGFVSAHHVEKVADVKHAPATKLTHSGADYTLVQRKAQPGDVVVFKNDDNPDWLIRAGNPYVVINADDDEDVEFHGEDGCKYYVYRVDYNRTEANVLVYEPVAGVFKVGDFAVITEKRHEYQIGDVVELTSVKGGTSAFDFAVRNITQKRTGNVRKSFIRKATDEEVAKATRPKTGDIVVITGNTNHSRNAVGDIGKVGKTSKITAKVEVIGRSSEANWSYYTEMRPANQAEVESYEDAVKALSAPKLKVGDYAKVIHDIMEYKAGDIVKITGDKAGSFFDFKVDKVTKGNYGYINAQDLELLDAKALVFAKVGRKVDEYKAGDVVRYIGGASVKGELVEVIGDTVGGRTEIKWAGSLGRCTEPNGNLELVAFVESRVDKSGSDRA